MTGFVYIWRDRKLGKFYIGSHWGDPDDGYVCSSQEMMHEWQRRPAHFRRRIIATVADPDELRAEESRWLGMIRRRPGRRDRYYNKVALVSNGRRLSIDLPESWHQRFKVACITNNLTMAAEVVELIQRRTAELEGTGQ
jgi:hypothetical protein